MAAIDSVSLKQLDLAIRKHAGPAKRFYADLDGRKSPYGGSVHDLNLLDPRDLKGEDIRMHGHAPASRGAYLAAVRGDLPSPVNVFSVLDKDNNKIGQVTNIGLKNVGARIDRGELLKFEADEREKVDKAKTRNTYITGTVTGEGRRIPNAESLGVAAGELFTVSKRGNSPLWVASREAGDPTSSGVLARRASFRTGVKPTVPSAQILR
jgi:hypothetical protein